MSTEDHRRYFEFGDFRLDPREKVLLRDNEPVPVTPKVFETLQIFLENPGRLLEKDELIRRIWQDRFVEEGNLPFTVKMLRRALSDEVNRPRFIETVPRRGYRFIADVSLVDESAAGGPDGAAIAPSRPRWRPIGTALSAVGLLVLGAIAALLLAGFGPARSASFLSNEPAPLKFEKFAGGALSSAVISPNGEYVAYVTETGGKQSVWLRRLETSENIQIVPPTDERYLGLTISNDGNSLYFVRRTSVEPHTSAIYRVMTFGGIPVKIAEKSEGWISVSPDDKQVLFTRCSFKDDEFCSLMLVDAGGGNERSILTRPRPIRLTDSQFAPDGKSVVFASGQSWSGENEFRLMVLDLATGSEKQLSPKTFYLIHHLEWFADGKGLLLTAREPDSPTSKIWHVSMATGTASVLTKDAIDYIGISLDRSGSKVIATRSTNSFHLYEGAVDDLENARDLSASFGGVAYAPGNRIVFEGSDGDIWTISADGTERRQLTNHPASDVLPRVSPDGRYIFFTSTRTGANQVWRMNLDGGAPIQLTHNEGGYPKRVTSDGKWLYYESSLQRTIWRIPADGGDASQVSKIETPYAAVSPDGSLVAYAAFVSGRERRDNIDVISIGTDSKIKSLTLQKDAKTFRSEWHPDGKGLYYVAESPGGNALWYESLNGAPPVLIANLGSDDIADFEVSADGKRIAFIRGRWISDAVLIEGLADVRAAMP